MVATLEASCISVGGCLGLTTHTIIIIIIFGENQSMKRHLLKQKMVDNNDTMKVLAQVLDIAPNTLYKKMQGTVQEFTQTEIRKIAERYDLTAEEIKDIFF